MTLFKSKYKARIEAKVKDLEAELQEVISLKKDTKQHIDPKQYAHYVVRQAGISVKIKLLKDLLI